MKNKKCLAALLLTACPKPSVHTPVAPKSAHSVYLTWTASTTPNVTYNVYRYSGACPGTGTATKINEAPVPNMQYTDTNVVGGATYCYYTTAYLQSASPPESVPSNQAVATIPADQPNPPTNLSVQPATADLQLNQKQQFTASGAVAPITWTIDPREGSISASGLYTAPSSIKGNNIKVTVTASDTNSAATAQITLRKN